MRCVRRILCAVGCTSVVAAALACGGASVPVGGSGKTAVSRPPATAEEQAERLDAIHKVQAAGLIGEISTRGRTCTVMVNRSFKLQPVKDKAGFAAIVYAWAFNLSLDGVKAGDGGTVQFLDNTTGKPYASYSKEYGFSVDE